jgi:hypothetical protein
MKIICAGIVFFFAFTNAAAQSARFTIQVEALRSEAAALALVEQLRLSGADAYYLKATIPGKGDLYRVRVGRFATSGQARAMGDKLRRAGLFKDHFVTKYEEAPSGFEPGQSPGSANQPPASQTSSAKPAAPALADSPRPLSERVKVKFEGRYWITNLKGAVNISGDPNTPINLRSDLGLQKGNLPEARFIWRPNPKRKLKLDFIQISYDGAGTLQQTIDYSRSTFLAGTKVVSSFEIKQVKFGYVWQSFNIKNRVKFGPQFEIRGLWTKSSLAVPGTGIKESTKATIPLPSIGFDLEAYPHRRFRFFAAFSGTPAASFGNFIDWEAGAEIFPAENLRLIGGYRALDLRGKKDDDFARLRLRGPFIGAGVRF